MLSEDYDPTLETAHILFTDIVGYSNLPMDRQPVVLSILQTIVRNSKTFASAMLKNSLLSLPTGDGIALVFFSNPLAPIDCALEITRALKSTGDFDLRMGIHSGPVYRVPDINANMNVAGGGINTAKRVMDCGDAGHILLSKRVDDDLSQFATWRDNLHDLGYIYVKHGVQLQISNFHGPDFGNAGLPKLFAIKEPSAQPSSDLASLKFRVVLLSEGDAEADLHLLYLLWSELNNQGHYVFIGRSRAQGADWVHAFEYQLRSAHVVIAIVSATSKSSETLAYEIQMAQDISQQANNELRLLAVCVDSNQPVPEFIAVVSDQLPSVHWSSKADDQSVVDHVVEMIGGSSEREKRARGAAKESTGGSVPLRSAFYVVRPTDEQFANSVKRHDSIVLIKGARQMGKTSLLARGLRQARSLGFRVVLTDFQKLNHSDFQNIEALYKALGGMIAEQLSLDITPNETWNSRRGASINFERFIRLEILRQVSGRVVWGLDEVDRLFTCPFGSEVFGLFRSWHNERSLDPDSPWDRLSLAIVYATEAHLFITDPNQSPFNVGTRLELKDFSITEVAELNGRYSQAAPLTNKDEMDAFYDLVGGQPYLVRKGLEVMSDSGLSFEALDKLADTEEGPFGDHLRRLLFVLARDTQLVETVREVIQQGRCSSLDMFYRLRSAGVLAGDSSQRVNLRCRLYTRFLRRHFLRT